MRSQLIIARLSKKHDHALPSHCQLTASACAVNERDPENCSENDVTQRYAPSMMHVADKSARRPREGPPRLMQPSGVFSIGQNRHHNLGEFHNDSTDLTHPSASHENDVAVDGIESTLRASL